MHIGFGSQGSSGLMGIQQQGLAAALQAQQTQGLLAALQAQAQAQQMTNRGLLPTPPNMRMMRQVRFLLLFSNYAIFDCEGKSETFLSAFSSIFCW